MTGIQEEIKAYLIDISNMSIYLKYYTLLQSCYKKIYFLITNKGIGVFKS